MKKSSEPAQNTKSTKTNQRTTLSQPVSKKKLGIIIVGIIVFLFGLGVIGKMTGVLMTSEQEKMQTYLEEKYGEKFVVGKATYKNGGFGIEGVWGAEAYPVQSKDIKFHVGSYQEKYSDYYVAALWTKQAEKEMQPVIDRIYGKDSSIIIKLGIWTTPPLTDVATKKSPTFKEAKILDNGFSYNIAVTNDQASNDDLQADINKISLLVDELQSQGVKQFSIDYRGKNGGDSYRCYLDNEHYAQFGKENILTKCMRKAEN